MGFLGDKGSVPLSSRYKLGTPYPIDIRQSVETEEDIWLLNTWGSYKALQQKWSFSMYPNMLVGVANTNIVYQLNGAVPVIIDQTATRFPEGTWQKLATQQWVEAQGYGQGSGSIDTTKIVTLDGEQIITGNKTFTGDVDFSNATVKGLAIDPADVNLAGYATEDWVNSQGFVTASYLDNILTFSTSGSEASAVNYSNDEVLFTEDLYVTNPVGNFVSGDNVKGLSLQEIITRLLKLETNI